MTTATLPARGGSRWPGAAGVAGLVLGITIISEFLIYLATRLLPGVPPLIGWSITCLLVGGAVLVLRGPEALVRRLIDLLAPVLPLAVWMVFSLSWSRNAGYGTEKLQTIALKALLPAILFAGLLPAGRRLRTRWILPVGVAGVIVAALSGGVFAEYPGRFTLPGLNPIWVGRVGWLIALAALVEPMARRWSRFGVALLGAGLGLMTLSRGPLIAFAVTLVLWFGLFRHQDQRLLRSVKGMALLAVSLTLAAMVVFAFGEQTATDYLAQLRLVDMRGDQNILGRFQMQQEALGEAVAHPLMGVGLGGLAADQSRWYPHNLIVEIGAELGLPGLLFTALLLILAWYRAGAQPHLRAFLLLAFFFALSSGDIAGNWMLWYFAMIALLRPAPGDP